MKKKATHYLAPRSAGGRGFCGVQGNRTTRINHKVTCGNCLKLMRFHGHEALPEDYDGPEIKKPGRRMTLRQQVALLEANGKELVRENERLSSEATASEMMADKWRSHAEAIQQLAAEGKDPLTGEEAEFWLVWEVEYDRNPTYKHDSRWEAQREAERLSCKFPGVKFYILPAFDYAICEVSPVTWKRKSSEKAPEFDHDEDVPF